MGSSGWREAYGDGTREPVACRTGRLGRPGPRCDRWLDLQAGPPGRRSTDADRRVQSAARRRQRARPARIEDARRVIDDVEVQDQVARPRVTAVVRGLRRVDQVSACPVRLVSRRQVAKRDEETAGVALDPEDRQSLAGQRPVQSDAGRCAASRPSTAPSTTRAETPVRTPHRARAARGRRQAGS